MRLQGVGTRGGQKSSRLLTHEKGRGLEEKGDLASVRWVFWERGEK